LPFPSIKLLRDNRFEAKSIQEEFPEISGEVVMNITYIGQKKSNLHQTRNL